MVAHGLELSNYKNASEYPPAGVSTSYHKLQGSMTTVECYSEAGSSKWHLAAEMLEVNRVGLRTDKWKTLNIIIQQLLTNLN